MTGTSYKREPSCISTTTFSPNNVFEAIQLFAMPFVSDV